MPLNKETKPETLYLEVPIKAILKVDGWILKRYSYYCQ